MMRCHPKPKQKTEKTVDRHEEIALNSQEQSKQQFIFDQDVV